MCGAVVATALVRLLAELTVSKSATSDPDYEVTSVRQQGV
jgi:hypothetical protein